METLAFEQFHCIFSIVNRCDEQMGVSSIGPGIPMTIHQVVIDFRRVLGQIGIAVNSGCIQFHIAGEQDVFAVGRERETVHIARSVSHLPTHGTVGVGLENLQNPIFVGIEEGNFLAVGHPYRLNFVVGRGRDLRGCPTGNGNRVKFGIALVLSIVEIFNRIEQGLAVRRNRWSGNPAEIPKDLFRKNALGEIRYRTVFFCNQFRIIDLFSALILAFFTGC